MESLDDVSLQPGARVGPVREASKSAVTWPAIFAGSIVAVASSLVLFTLGSGLGFASISPWANIGASITSLSVFAAIWLIVVQWISAGLGGYLTGRLRTRWVSTHTHEVFFRDTAHGFVTWAVATLILALVLAFVAAAVASTGVKAAATVGSGAAQAVAATTKGPDPYDVESLFRSAQPDANTPARDVSAEATHILAKGLSKNEFSPEDRSYLTNLVAARTGVSQEDAKKRVGDVVAQVEAAELKARQAADAARKAAAAASILTALAMLIGAFIACAAAALGGRERDLHP